MLTQIGIFINKDMLLNNDIVEELWGKQEEEERKMIKKIVIMINITLIDNNR